MSRVMRWYRRLRHSRGYGVHSPSAYALVRDVIHPPRGYGYYCYDRLPRSISYNIPGTSRRSALDPRLVMRLALWCRPGCVLISGAEASIVPAIEASISCGCPEAVCILDSDRAAEADMVIDLGRGPLHIPAEARVVMCRRSREALELLSVFKTGILMRGRHRLLYLATPAPVQILDMWL